MGTDTDPGIYACYTVMMVNRPILDRYNEDGSGPAMVADSTRTHMAAGQEREKGRRNPQTEKKEKMVALELLCYVFDIYIYMSNVCVSKEEIVASGNAAKKKKKGGTDQRRYFERPLAYPQRSTC